MNGTLIPELTTTYNVYERETWEDKGRDGVINETEQADV
jgi:hypothetical protein